MKWVRKGQNEKMHQIMKKALQGMSSRDGKCFEALFVVCIVAFYFFLILLQVFAGAPFFFA